MPSGDKKKKHKPTVSFFIPIFLNYNNEKYIDNSFQHWTIETNSSNNFQVSILNAIGVVRFVEMLLFLLGSQSLSISQRLK